MLVRVRGVECKARSSSMARAKSISLQNDDDDDVLNQHEEFQQGFGFIILEFTTF